MSLLSDYSLQHALNQGHLKIEPYEPAHLGPSSYDLTLDEHVLRPDPAVRHIDVADVPAGHMHRVPVEDGIFLAPGEFLLASTREVVTLSSALAARVEGRSSVGRLGVTTHVTAGFIDNGFSGHITLEVVNHAPWAVTLRPGMRLAQLAVFRTTTPVVRSYSERGHYMGQRGPTESRLRIGATEEVS